MQVIYALVPHEKNFIIVWDYIYNWFLLFIVKNNPWIFRNTSAVIKLKCFLKIHELAIYYVYIIASLCLVINCNIINS